MLDPSKISSTDKGTTT